MSIVVLCQTLPLKIVALAKMDRLALSTSCVGLQLKQGETFQSDTDTEVIPKLCKWIYHHLPSPMPFSEVCIAAACC